MRCLPALLLCTTLVGAPGRLAAQHGEVQLGALVAYGTADTHGVGVGAVAGVALGRLVYAGLRWVHLEGSTETITVADGSLDVTTRAQLLLGDLGLILPVRGLEVVPGVSLGAVRFRQPQSEPSRASEFVIAPGIAVHTYLGGFVLIPEIQYYVAGTPDLRLPVDQDGLVASLRLVIPIEVGRIRH